MKEKLKQIFGRTDEVLSEYAFVLLVALLTAVSSIALHENSRYYWDNYSESNRQIIEQSSHVFTKFAWVSALGISLLFALNILSQRIGRKLLLNVTGIVFLILYYLLFLPEEKQDFGIVHTTVLVVSFVLSHLLVAFVAFINRREIELNFWQYNKNLFINTFLTLVFTGVLTGGIELAVLAVDKLFDFNFNNRIYFNIFLFLSIFGSCFIFLLFNEKGLQYLEQEEDYPVVLKFFTQYVLIPLLIIYAVILYFYAGKIVMSWSLPRGWVSYLILAYSLVGILALLLVYPLKEHSAKSWVKVFSKIFYFTLVPLIVLLFIAIFTRILEYGYTENRYFVLLLAIWLSVVVLYFIMYKKASIRFIPISLFVFGLFALVFPYFNTFSVAKRSQKTGLQQILTENNLLTNGKIDFKKAVRSDIADEIAEKFQFLNERKEQEFLLNFIVEDKKSKEIREILFHDRNRWYVQPEIRNLFTNVVTTEQESESNNNFSIVARRSVFKTLGYDYAISLALAHNNEKYEFENCVIEIEKKFPFNEEVVYKLKLKKSGKDWKEYNLVPFMKEFTKQYQGRKGEVMVDEISHEFELENYVLKIYWERINMSKDGFSIYGEDFILIKKK
ncbi:MAG: DUF4153 domain-containing protein [Cloacibacterium sp.]|nr:DUF4153 domain-containing protein [Cloacibacterium sp.]